MAFEICFQLRNATVASLSVGLMLSASSASAAGNYRSHWTGAQLVRDMQADPRIDINMVRRERAMGFLEGISDATVARDWCPASTAIPHELNFLLVERVARFSPARQKGDAAPLVVAALAAAYPCRSGGKR